MNTEQSYVGKGDSTTPNPETAQNAAQTPSTADRRKVFLQQLINHPSTAEYLEAILDTVEEFLGTTDPVPSLNDLLIDRIQQTALYWTEEKCKRHICDMLNLTTFLVNLRSVYTCFEIESESVNH